MCGDGLLGSPGSLWRVAEEGLKAHACPTGCGARIPAWLLIDGCLTRGLHLSFTNRLGFLDSCLLLCPEGVGDAKIGAEEGSSAFLVDTGVRERESA